MTKLVPTVLILGGTSAVAQAYAREAAKKGENIILVGRNKAKLTANVDDLNARSDGYIKSFVVDLEEVNKISKNWDNILKELKSIDRILVAYGMLGDQTRSQDNIDNLRTELITNFVSTSMWCELAFQYFRQKGTGQLTVIGSVAGDRGRQSNYHYGAAKGGLEIFIEGMAHRAAKLKEARVSVLLIKPGFIDTPMTDHLEKGGPLWSTPEKISKIIRRSERRGKRVVYAPWYWRFILIVIRYVPFFIFKQSSL